MRVTPGGVKLIFFVGGLVATIHTWKRLMTFVLVGKDLVFS